MNNVNHSCDMKQENTGGKEKDALGRQYFQYRPPLREAVIPHKRSADP
jgi:hypothetical protein